MISAEELNGLATFVQKRGMGATVRALARIAHSEADLSVHEEAAVFWRQVGVILTEAAQKIKEGHA